MTKKTNTSSLEKRSRATDEEKERRIELAVNFIVQGASRAQVIAALAKSEHISSMQARRYLDMAYENIRTFAGQPTLETAGLLGKRLEYCLSKAMLDKNYPLITEILKFQINMLQMQYKYPTAGVISHDATSTSRQSKQAELEELVRRIESRRSSHE